MELISYAMDFASFLMQNLKDVEREKIKSIILFGSVARGVASKESDVDIFIDVVSFEKKLEKEINEIKDEFYNSVKYTKYWKLLDKGNEINIIVGMIDEWKLKDSMVGNSFTLYQPYSPKLQDGDNKVILFWDSIENNSRRVMLNKKIFGYNHYGKLYKGILEIYGGKKLGSNVIIIPAENLNLFLKAFHKFKISVKIKRIFEYKG